MGRYIKDFIFNLVLLAVILIVLYLVMPGVFGQVYQAMGILFGPGLILLMVIIAALPSRRHRY